MLNIINNSKITKLIEVMDNKKEENNEKEINQKDEEMVEEKDPTIKVELLNFYPEKK